ncbi:uncharacterized protein LOC120845873 [Ixodes scapularis]|uniref:uncharacterized protein LOC120845873 n=1 Tax=Ixodes scapularis TaxID=6945 RepID=UPI001A9FBD8B|nr:uncharacterized protein LOC120845873 [Ixodes scapularis]
MKLHKWGSNSAVLKKMLEDNVSEERVLGQLTGVVKVLGITWESNEDKLSFTTEQVVEFTSQRRNTKRFVLQTTARLYDPLGFLSPFVNRGKILFQEIWKRNLRWDDTLPGELMGDWESWCDELTKLGQISVPRYYDSGLSNIIIHRALHVFSDASSSAYGSIIFLCSTDDRGTKKATILLAKCRVAPLKEISLARLELMASLIGSRLLKYVKTCLEIQVDEVHFWTDSMITLHWIRGEASRWKTFVKDQVLGIQGNSGDAKWHHCPGKANPADLMTRGLKADRLLSAALWWTGPTWLQLPATEWPEETVGVLSHDKLEEKASKAVVTLVPADTSVEFMDISRFSSAARLHRTTAWVLRFVHNLRSPIKTTGSLSAEEIQAAQTVWIKKAQSSTFASEISCAAGKKVAPPGSALQNFQTFVDQEGVLRIKGQLAKVNKKLDLLLSKKDTVDTLHDLHPKVDALLSMKQVVDTMQDSLNALQESVNFVSAQYDSLVTTAKSQDHTIKAMQLELSALRSSTAEQALEIHRLKSYQNDKEQVDRLSNMEIHGIPLKTQENIRDIMSDLAEKIEVEDFQAVHVMSAHRLPARPARPAAIPPIMETILDCPN